jgi:hypothetical protein
MCFEDVVLGNVVALVGVCACEDDAIFVLGVCECEDREWCDMSSQHGAVQYCSLVRIVIIM